MREFLHLAKTLNFTKTATELYISQPTLSKHVQAMEEELGVPLLVRGSRGVSLTPEGEVACEHLSAIVDEYDQMARELKMVSAGISGSIRVGYMANGGFELIDAGVERFYAAYPGIELTFDSLSPNRVIRTLQEGRIDVGLVFQTASLPAGEFEFKKVGEYPWKVVVSEGNPLAHREEISFEDLAGQPFIQARSDREFSELQARLMDENGFEPAEIVYCSGTDLIPAILRSKGGYFIGVDALPREHLVGLPLAGCSSGIPVGLVYAKGSENACIPLFMSFF